MFEGCHSSHICILEGSIGGRPYQPAAGVLLLLGGYVMGRSAA